MKTAENRTNEAELNALRRQLRNAKAQIRHLKNERSRLASVELGLLSEIAECHLDDAYEVTLADNLQLSKGRLEFHLTRLLKRGYIEVRFVDPEFGDNFAITQKGRRALFQPSLH